MRDSRHAGVAFLCSTRQQQSVRWREGISLELFRRWARCKRTRCRSTRWRGDGTGDRARVRRRCLGRGPSLVCERLRWDRKQLDPTIRVRMLRTLMPVNRSSLLCQQSLEQEKNGMLRWSSWPRWVHWKERQDPEVRSNSGISRISHHRQREQSINFSQQRMQKSSGECNP